MKKHGGAAFCPQHHILNLDVTMELDGRIDVSVALISKEIFPGECVLKSVLTLWRRETF
jgi:hypothetical protein